MVSVASQILDVLRDNGIDTVFGIPGGAISRVYAELAKRKDIRVINAVHEANALFMAIGYAQSTGKPAVALTTSGPGFTNAITGLASAHADSVPVLLIAGEVPRSSFGRGALQEGSAHGFDAVAMARPVTKCATQLARPTAAVTTVRKAIATMTSGKPGPAFISLPLDVANAEVAQQSYAGSPCLGFKIDRDACAKAGSLLMRARRPLILVGAGARSEQSRNAVLELAHKAKCPVAVTPKGKSAFPEDDERYLGVFGFAGHESVIEYLKQKPDVILVCGSSLNDVTTNAWSPLLASTTSFIQIDVDAGQLGKNYPVDVGLLGPLHEIIPEMLACNEAPSTRDPHPRLTFQPVPKSSFGALSAGEVVNAMNEVCPRDALFTTDIGEHHAAALHFLRTRTPGAFNSCFGFSSMGSGIVSAIGHALGANRRVFSICGDGGFLMSGNDLVTAVKHGAPVTFVIMNDRRLNMVHHGLTEQYGAAPDCTIGDVDFAQMANAFGAKGFVARTIDDVMAALRIRTGVVVIDARIDPDARLPKNARVAALKQFTE